MNFVKDHKELYDKTSKHFKDKARVRKKSQAVCQGVQDLV